MKYRVMAALIAVSAMAVSALAGDKPHTQISIANLDDATQEEVRVDLDSESLGFELRDLQVGENRSVVDKNGQNVLITREAEGFRFDVDGKTIQMPLLEGKHHGGPGSFVHAPGVDKEIRIVRAHGGPIPPMMGGPDGIVIMSGSPIDDATRQSIKSILESAGHDSEVHFVERMMAPHAPGDGFRVIEKRVEVKN